jgi:hypothetical protein
VRVHCLDAEDGRDGEVRVSYLRYDTAIRAGVEEDREAATLAYEFDDGPGAFGGGARRRFLDWVLGLVRWPAPRRAAPVPEPLAHAAPGEPPAEIWSRPRDARPV